MEQKDSSAAQNVLDRVEVELRQLPASQSKDELQLRWIEQKQSLDPQSIGQSELDLLSSIASQNSNHRTQSYALGTIGRIYQEKGDRLEAIKYNQQALTLARENEAYDLSYRWQWQLGKLLRDSNYEEAVAYYKNAVVNLDRVRSDLIAFNADTQFSFKSSIEPVYREMVSLILKQPTQENLTLARNTIESLQMAELENYFRSACLRAEPKQIDTISSTTATIYPIVLEKELAVITSIGKDLVYQSYPIEEGEVAQTVADFILEFNPARSRRRREALGTQIYEWLIAPNEDKFTKQKIDTLVFVLDNDLRNLPIAAINAGDKYLIERYKIALTPGLQLLPSRPIAKDKLEAVVGGLSEARQGFAPLPGVKQEVEEIASTINTNLLLNSEFTNQELKTALAKTKKAPILHLATHGQFSSNPEETFVVTWEDKLNVTEMESLLKVREETPKLVPIELLMLSACKTATGDAKAALGLAGVAIKSGARSTIATLWSVNDESTSMLVNEMYQQLKNTASKGEVLRQAQLKLIKSEAYSHPYYWSPFVLVGNWN